MEGEDDFVLRIVESREGLPEPELAPKQVPSARRDLTPYEVLDVLRATKGAVTVIEQIPAIAGPDLWGEVASFSVCETSGTAFDEVFLWDCDHVGFIGSMKNNLANCYAVFTANEESLAVYGSPGTLTGRVSCIFHAPSDGSHVFHVQLQTFINAEISPSTVECFIDQKSFGQLQLSGPVDRALVANLNTGFHRFDIQQVSGSFFFQKLRVWSVPGPAIP